MVCGISLRQAMGVWLISLRAVEASNFGHVCRAPGRQFSIAEDIRTTLKFARLWHVSC